MGVPDLIETGIRAYLAGREEEALVAFQEVLRADPQNAKARWYVDRIVEATHLTDAVRKPPAGKAPVAPRLDLEFRPEEPAPLAPPVHGRPLPELADGGEERRGREPSLGSVTSLADDEYAPSPWDDGPAAAPPIELDPSGGLDLGAIAEKSDLRPLVPEGGSRSLPPRSDVEVWLSAAKELFALGDFSGSLELIEKILQVDPEHGEARDYLRQNEATLISMYESKLGPLSCVPRLAVKPEEILWLNLDHRAGFLLAQIDGTVDYDSLFALSGLPRLDTARILANLIADGVITS